MRHLSTERTDKAGRQPLGVRQPVAVSRLNRRNSAEPGWRAPSVDFQTMRLAGLQAVREFLMICAFCGFLWRFLFLIGGDAFGEGVAVDAQDRGSV